MVRVNYLAKQKQKTKSYSKFKVKYFKKKKVKAQMKKVQTPAFSNILIYINIIINYYKNINIQSTYNKNNFLN